MGSADKKHWAELQTALAAAGLKISLGKMVDLTWGGMIDDKVFVMSLPPVDENDGIRDFMAFSLFGQDEAEIIPKLSSFMGYSPFCGYQDRKLLEEATTTFEWDRKNPVKRFAELEKDGSIFELRKLEEGFTFPAEPEMSRFYRDFTPETLQVWEETLERSADLSWGNQTLRLLLPFFRKVMPRTGVTQSLHGFSIISLIGKHLAEEKIVKYGLEPLLKAGVITAQDEEKILDWYAKTQLTQDPVTVRQVEVEFKIDGVRYLLWTHAYRNHRDLNLRSR